MHQTPPGRPDGLELQLAKMRFVPAPNWRQCRAPPSLASPPPQDRPLEEKDMSPKPIELHYWPTPNGHKITIMLEECGIPYAIKPVNIGKGDQFKPEFLAIAPNN